MKFELIHNRYIDLLKNIRDSFNNSHISIHKARNEIKTIEFHNENLVIKSFKIPNIINKIVYTFFRDSKAKKSYKNSIKILDFVPKPIGYIEFKEFGLIAESYFVSENFEYNFTIREALVESNFFEKESIFKAFAEFTFRLHENGIFHLDYSPGNILIKKEPEGYTFKIVDINRMEFKNIDLETGLDNFAKLWLDEDSLRLIATEYAKLSQNNEKIAIDILKKCDKRLKDFVEFKRKIRGRK